jgi:hypothetical protein
MARILKKPTIITDPNMRKLESIESALQDLLIIQGALAGMSKANVRRMVGVADAHVSKIWRNIKIKPKE